MKKIIVVLAVAMAGVFIFANAGLCLSKGNLYNMYRKEPVVKVFLSDVVNASESTEIDTKGLKQKLKDVLEKRKSIRFEVVDNKEEADIAIDCDVTKYSWRSDDPLDMIAGTAAIAYDIFTSENYAYLEAVFTVTDIKSEKELWEKKLKIDLTRKKMSLQESLALINEKTAKIFMRDCFSKGRSKRR